MRIGTWNLAGRWDGRHEHLLHQQDCDVWLLTEVSERLVLSGYTQHNSIGCMAQRRRWAAILSRRPLVAFPDPHPASALARSDNLTFCCSILPWRSCGGQFPWVGDRHADRTRVALNQIIKALPQNNLVWGGDWNHALTGREYAGSQEGRTYILEMVDALSLKVPTAALDHRLPNLLTIDHIAVGQTVTVISSMRIDASNEGIRLSDHDAYVVEIA